MLCSRYKCAAARLTAATCTVLAACAILGGCAGNGDGLDANGQPIGSGTSGGSPGTTTGVTADFQSIQDNVFTPICTQCHIGASAPQGLQLDAAHSYALLVGVPSNEKPSVLRVKPSDPDNSYMMQKLEGAAGIVGGQMPLDQAPLPQATLAAIRQWIANGAMMPAAVGLTAKLELNRGDLVTGSFAVTVTAPLDGDDILAPLSTIVVAFNHDVDASLLNYTTITLEMLADGQPPRLVATSANLAGTNASSVVIRPNTALTPGKYRVTVRGTGGGALADTNAQVLGADFTFEFTVSPAS